MKNKPFDCVEMKRRAQEQVRAVVEKLSAAEREAYYEQVFAEMKKRQAALLAHPKKPISKDFE